jgi:hypothetical protein
MAIDRCKLPFAGNKYRQKEVGYYRICRGVKPAKGRLGKMRDEEVSCPGKFGRKT